MYESTHGGVRGRGSNPPTYSIIVCFVLRAKVPVRSGFTGSDSNSNGVHRGLEAGGIFEYLVIYEENKIDQESENCVNLNKS